MICNFQMRREMVNQMKGQNYLRVKQHYDDMVSLSLYFSCLFYFSWPLFLDISGPPTPSSKKEKEDHKIDIKYPG